MGIWTGPEFGNRGETEGLENGSISVLAGLEEEYRSSRKARARSDSVSLTPASLYPGSWSRGLIMVYDGNGGLSLTAHYFFPGNTEWFGMVLGVFWLEYKGTILVPLNTLARPTSARLILG